MPLVQVTTTTTRMGPVLLHCTRHTCWLLVSVDSADDGVILAGLASIQYYDIDILIF